MHPYISELLKKNAGLTIDGKLAKIRDKYRERGVPTLLDESLNEMLLLLYLRQQIPQLISDQMRLLHLHPVP